MRNAYLYFSQIEVFVECLLKYGSDPNEIGSDYAMPVQKDGVISHQC